MDIPPTLSRAEKRRLNREAEKQNKSFNMTAGTLSAALEEAARKERERVISIIVHQYSVVVAMTMHDTFGFGPVRLQRVLDALTNLWDSVERDYVSISDLEQVIWEETGIDLRSESNGNSK